MLTLPDLWHSNTADARGLNNEPDDAQKENLRELLDRVLTPVDALVGIKRVSSGFRSIALNAIVGGEKKSDHLLGRAADIIPVTEIAEAFDTIARDTAIPFDQLIYEVKRARDGRIVRWLHISWRPDPRRQVLRAELTEKEDGTTHKQYFTHTPRK